MSCLRVADARAGLPNPSLLDVAVPQVLSFQGRVRGSLLGFSHRAGEDGQTQRGGKGVCVAWLVEESWRRCPEDRWMRREGVRQVSVLEIEYMLFCLSLRRSLGEAALSLIHLPREEERLGDVPTKDALLESNWSFACPLLHDEQTKFIRISRRRPRHQRNGGSRATPRPGKRHAAADSHWPF